MFEANKTGATQRGHKHDYNPPKLPYDIFEKHVSRMFDVYISEPLGDVKDYVQLLGLFRNTSPSDVIRVHINCPGGNVFAGIQILAAMKECQAKIITVLDGEACSMAPFLLFAGDEIEVMDHGIMMFHNYSAYAYGKANETRSRMNAMDVTIRELMEEYCKPFLSDEEIEQVIKGEDIWLTASEIRERMDSNFAGTIQSQIQEEQERLKALAEQIASQMKSNQEEDDEEPEPEPKPTTNKARTRTRKPAAKKS